MGDVLRNIRALGNTKPHIDMSVWVDPMAVIIGDVILGADCSVWPMAVIRGDMHHIRVGERVSVQDGAVLHITHSGPETGDGYPLVIGNDVTIGHQACLHGCTLGSEILVGIGATVLDGAVIEDRVIIGAGALVPPGKVLKSGYLYVGTPAKASRPLSDKELRYFTYTAANYVRLKDQYRAEASLLDINAETGTA